MKRILLITLLCLVVISVSSSATTAIFAASNTTATFNCKTIVGWLLKPVTPIGSSTAGGLSCRAAKALVEIIGSPSPENTKEQPIKEAEVFAPNLPQVPGTPDPAEGIPQLIAFIYGFAIWIVGAVVFIQITRAGVMWLLAAGRPGPIGQAKSLITNAIFGLILLLSSVVILNTINPSLTVNSFALPKLTGATPGFDPSLVP